MKDCAALLREAWPEIRFAPVYSSAAKYEENQADFLNSVAMVETDEPPEDVHEVLLSIENTLKKAIEIPMGPRTIDLDILLYDNEIIHLDDLEIPHPRLQERKFVLAPLSALIDTNTTHPVLHETWASLLEKTQDQACEISDIVL